MRPDRPNLLISMFMALPHELPIFAGATFKCELTHDCSSLFRIVAGCAHKHHGHNLAWLLGSHVQKCIASAAQAYRFEAFNTQMVEQSKYVECALPKGELHRRVGRPAMTAQVWYHQLVLTGEVMEEE